ncbi:MAG: hypothetical protein OEV55_09245, partial [candidate division Zixibacteria bacterium]|nr:hypothetical protein [candidate division Zixibacteria bacterium]
MHSISAHEFGKPSLKNWKLIFILLITLSVCLSTNILAQGVKVDKTIDFKIQAEIIDSVSHALNEFYVFPAVAKEMEKHIRKQYR